MARASLALEGGLAGYEICGQGPRKFPSQNSGYYQCRPIDVVEDNGNHYIVDGHHRASVARQAHTKVSIVLKKNIESRHSIFNNVDEVKESADNAGLDRLVRRRR